MPRCKSVVKIKHVQSTRSSDQPRRSEFIQTLGLIDLHFHGAFGIDLMTAPEEDLNQLSLKLWQNGIAAFCPTTLSEKPGPLLTTVRRLGHWIRSFDGFYGPGPQKKTPGAIPLGIHLEGPFIHPKSCGAHPPQTIRPLSIQELESLWEASQQTLKIITLAPELISSANLTRVIRWAKAKKIHLSLGHSQATTEEARLAFQKGIQGVTHAWNALPFHHRSPGPLGAAIGNPEIFLELILDQIHVDPVLIRWTQNSTLPSVFATFQIARLRQELVESSSPLARYGFA